MTKQELEQKSVFGIGEPNTALRSILRVSLI